LHLDALAHRTDVHERRGHARRGIETGQRLPSVIATGVFGRLAREPVAGKPRDPRAQHVHGLGTRSPFPPRRGIDVLPVPVHAHQELAARDPDPPHRRIHDLEPRADAPPHDDEVRESIRQRGHDHRRQQALVEVEVVDRHHDLFGVETELARDLLDGVDRCAVERRLTGLAQPAIARRQSEAVEDRLERRGAAVDGRGLDRLRDQEAHQRVTPRPGPCPRRGGARRRG
jgi:hypothetical protein